MGVMLVLVLGALMVVVIHVGVTSMFVMLNMILVFTMVMVWMLVVMMFAPVLVVWVVVMVVTVVLVVVVVLVVRVVFVVWVVVISRLVVVMLVVVVVFLVVMVVMVVTVVVVFVWTALSMMILRVLVRPPNARQRLSSCYDRIGTAETQVNSHIFQTAQEACRGPVATVSVDFFAAAEGHCMPNLFPAARGYVLGMQTQTVQGTANLLVATMPSHVLLTGMC